MKYLSLGVFLVLVVTTGTARADISLQWRQVTPDSGTVESGYTADIPEGFVSWQLFVTTDTRWIGSEMEVVLDEGTIYYNGVGRITSPSPADAALVSAMPSARFGSHFSGAGLDAADGQRQIPGFWDSQIPGRGNKYTQTEIDTTWLTPDPLLDTAGTHVIAMLTLSDDAMGTIRVTAIDPERATQLDPVTGEVTAEANPFVLESTITNGVIPEPSTALLAIVGLIGLVLGTTRRSSRRA